MRISKEKYKIKTVLELGYLKTIIKKDTIYFLDYNKLQCIRIFINTHDENIVALGYELCDEKNMYFQHLGNRYPAQKNLLINSLN